MTGYCKDYLTHIFEEFDRDKDGVLSRAEQADMFSTAPQE